MRSRLLFVVAQEPIFIEGRLFLLFVDRVEILLGESLGLIPCHRQRDAVRIILGYKDCRPDRRLKDRRLPWS
jgi:hypothetical protein